MEFINREEVLQVNKVTYVSFVSDYSPLKSEPWRVRLVVGDDKLENLQDVGSPATSLLKQTINL